MITHATTAGHTAKVSQREIVVDQLLEEALRRRFFGIVAVDFNVQDGVIQRIRRKVERIEK